MKRKNIGPGLLVWVKVRTHGREQEERLFRGLQGKGVAWLWSTRTLKRMTKS